MVRCLFAFVLLAASHAFAAGFFRPGIGVGNLGAGGTGIVNGSPGYGHWYNPALLSLTKGTAELTLDWTALDEDFTFKRSREGLLPPERLQDDADAGNYYSQRLADNCCSEEPDGGVVDQAGMRHIPFLGIAFPIRDDLVLGLAVYGPQGPRRDMQQTGSQRYGVVSTDITLAITQFTAAYRSKSWGLGLGLANYALSVSQVFTLSGDLEGTENPGYDAFAAVKVEDGYIPVANIGFWAEPMSGLRIGGAYQRPLEQKCTGSGEGRICGHVLAEGTVTPELGPDLAQLASVTNNDGGALIMRFPEMARFGVSQRVGRDVEVAVEGYYEAWGSIGDLTFAPKNVVFNALGSEIVLENIIFPRRWEDSYGARLGVRWDVAAMRKRAPLQMRFGGQWESSASPLSEIDPGALDWEKLGLSIGFGIELLKGLHVDAFYLKTLTADLTVTNSKMRTANILHADNVAGGGNGLETVSGNGDYHIAQQRFGLGLRYALGVN